MNPAEFLDDLEAKLFSGRRDEITDADTERLWILGGHKEETMRNAEHRMKYLWPDSVIGVRNYIIGQVKERMTR